MLRRDLLLLMASLGGAAAAANATAGCTVKLDGAKAAQWCATIEVQ